MANCFGVEVDNFMLNQDPLYKKLEKTQELRARVAMEGIYDDRKRDQAEQYVQSVKEWYGIGQSTLCLVYNATGETLHYVADHSWSFSHIGRTPYPTEIGNGQWAAFHHVHSNSAHGSEGAVVYSGKNKHGQDKDYLLGWCTPFFIGSNKAYCEIAPGGLDHFQQNWDSVYNNVYNADYSCTANPDGSCAIEANTARGESPTFVAIIKTYFA